MADQEDDNQLPPWLAGNPVLDAEDDEEERGKQLLMSVPQGSGKAN